MPNDDWENHKGLVKNGVSLQQYFESRLREVKNIHEAYIKTLEKRLDGMNEFREALREQSNRMITKDEHKASLSILGKIENDVQSLELTRAEMAGKASMQSVILSYLIAVISLIISLVGLAIRW
jgi:hypothetical protein